MNLTSDVSLPDIFCYVTQLSRDIHLLFSFIEFRQKIYRGQILHLKKSILSCRPIFNLRNILGETGQKQGGPPLWQPFENFRVHQRIILAILDLRDF